jgi:hypothetical protein
MPHLPPVAAALAVLLLSATASAQDTTRAGPALEPDTRIRMTVASSLRPVTGVVVAHRGDTLIVRTDADGRTMTVPLAQVIRLDVSRGATTNTRRGAVVGLGSGALVGLVLGAVTYKKPDCSDVPFCLDFGPGPDMLVGASLGGVAGAFVGAVIGSARTEIWEPAEGILDERTRLGIAPAPRGGVAFTMSRAF